MLLYHGSNIEVIKPRLEYSRRNLDFGRAFYLTSDYDQAAKWAARASQVRGNGRACVSVFFTNEALLKDIRVKIFGAPNAEWLRYVALNRTADIEEADCDLVVGPVANDQTIRTINDYIRGRFSEEIAIQLLLPQKLKDQYAFKTEAALSCITFQEAIGL